jgi:putative chitinase
MNRGIFYTKLRAERGLFGATISTRQVETMEALLDAGAHLPISWMAYALATALGETRMDYTKTENMNYSAERIRQVWPRRFPTLAAAQPFARNPEGLANHVYGGRLGNTQPGDGWRFRGHGLVQVTGRDNFEKVGRLLRLDLVRNPSLLLTPGNGARTLLLGIEQGIYTGKNASHYLPRDRAAVPAEFQEARRIINGTFEAAKYAEYAMKFQSALQAAEYRPSVEVATPRPPATPAAPAPQPPAPAPVGGKPPIGLLVAVGGILAALAAFFGWR